MFQTLTIAREYASGGGAIAQTVAERLGWDLLDGSLIDTIARAAQVAPETVRRYDEEVDSWLHRLLRGGVRAAAAYGQAVPMDAQFFDAETTAAIARKVIVKAGVRGRCVIVGRGAQCALRGFAQALHVFIYAPWQERFVRLTVTPRARATLAPGGVLPGPYGWPLGRIGLVIGATPLRNTIERHSLSIESCD